MRKAFTLIELFLVSTILLVLGLIFYSSLRSDRIFQERLESANSYLGENPTAVNGDSTFAYDDRSIYFRFPQPPNLKSWEAEDASVTRPSITITLYPDILEGSPEWPRYVFKVFPFKKHPRVVDITFYKNVTDAVTCNNSTLFGTPEEDYWVLVIDRHPEYPIEIGENPDFTVHYTPALE